MVPGLKAVLGALLGALASLTALRQPRIAPPPPPPPPPVLIEYDSPPVFKMSSSMTMDMLVRNHHTQPGTTGAKQRRALVSDIVPGGDATFGVAHGKDLEI